MLGKEGWQNVYFFFFFFEEASRCVVALRCQEAAKHPPAAPCLWGWHSIKGGLFWGLSKSHHGEEAVSVGMLRGCQGTAGERIRETRDLFFFSVCPAARFIYNEEKKSHSCYTD